METIDNVDRRFIPILHASVGDIYNLPLFESYLVIDTRTNEQYQQQHIVTAISFLGPTFQQEPNNIFLQFLEYVALEGLTPERYSPVVIYGDNSESSQNHTKWLSERLSQLPQNPISSLVTRKLTKLLCKRLEENTCEIWIIEGGYEAFNASFPILCGILSLDDIGPLPCMMAPGLFLGSRASNDFERRVNGQLCIDRKTLSQLNIQYIVVSSNMPLNLADTDGLWCFRCAMQDSDSVEMNEYWTAAVTFIEDARAKGGNVLIQVYGRSRSASFMVAWAKHVLHLNFKDAFDYVLKRCFYKIDTSCMYLDQLRKWTMVGTSLESPSPRPQITQQ